MKHSFLLLFLLALLNLSVQAQTWDEWFRQKETQKDYLVQQIAALQAYAGTLRQGYEALGRGISTVQHSKNGDLGLHRVFFHALRQVSPVIGQSTQLTDMLRWQSAILRDFSGMVQQVRSQALFSPREMEYLERVNTQVLRSCNRDMESLWLLVTSDVLALPDADRLQQLAVLHQAMRDRYRFTRHFIEACRALLLLRKREQKDIQDLNLLHRKHQPSLP